MVVAAVAVTVLLVLLVLAVAVAAQVRNAARIVGDPALYRKMEAASELIKRDIVFATSLYLS